MGYTTDFIGHIDIDPALNQDEIEYLTAFSESRRFDRVEGPYAVPGNPAAENQAGRADIDNDRYSRCAPGQPQLWCQWAPCWDGCCLSFDGNEKFYEPIAWLRYLIAHFLKPGAAASRSGLPAFDGFTFDHRLDGMVVGCRRDTKQLFSINVSRNRVTERTLRPGLQEYVGREPLPYETAIDRENEGRRRRRRGALPAAQVAGDLAGSEVIDLASRRV